MRMEKIVKEAFVVIGREGSTQDGPGFVQKLWADADAHFEEVAHLAKKDENGNLIGLWGAMTDFSRSFRPWEDGFSRGLYLAGVECADDARAPEGWSRWVIPGFEYLRVECDHEGVFTEVIAYLQKRNIALAGAVHDYTCPGTGKNYMVFPIRELLEENRSRRKIPGWPRLCPGSKKEKPSTNA